MMPKQAWEKYREKEPTNTAEIVVECYADKRLFLPDFNDMPEPMQELFWGKDKISLPCEGSGVLTCECRNCVFGEVVED